MKPARKWKTPTSRARKEEEEEPNANKASNVQARTIKGVFMFCRTAQTIKETKRPLPALPELPSHQDHGGDKEDTAKKPRHWSRFEKFRVGTRKTQGAYHMDNTSKKSRETVLTLRKTNPYELRDQELKTEGGKQAKGKFLNWKIRQQQKLEKNTEVLDVSKFLWRKV